MRVLHVAYLDKFIPQFIELIRSEFPEKNNYFFTYGHFEKNSYPINDDSIHIENIDNKIFQFIFRYPRLIKEIMKSDKVIFHGLFDFWALIISLIFFRPFFRKKKFIWLPWGGDFYKDLARGSGLKDRCIVFLKRIALKRIDYVANSIVDDFLLIKKMYSINPGHINSFLYPSNVVEVEYQYRNRCDEPYHILIGNSGDSTNCHIDAFKKLSELDFKNYVVYCPLSYGDSQYISMVISLGNEFFGSNFKPILEFMTYEVYLEFLKDIDIAIFPNNRQQAMGNIRQLLGMGKKVYIRKDISTWSYIKALGVKVYDLSEVDISLDMKIGFDNSLIMNKSFSREKLLDSWSLIFLV